MHTWEMMKEIMNHPEKKFYDKNEPDAGNVYSDGVDVRWEDTAEIVAMSSIFERDWQHTEKRVVDFMEAIKSGRRVRVEHPHISEEYEKDELSREFRPITSIFEVLGVAWHDEAVRDVLTQGKWFIEN